MRYLLPASAVILTLASCVGKKNFTVMTDPPGATVTINGRAIEGTTPVTATIKQDKDLGIVARKPGYETTSQTVKTKHHKFYSLIWTQKDPRAQYIPQDSTTIKLTPIPGAANYTPSTMQRYDGHTLPAYPDERRSGGSSVPSLRPMPSDF